MLAQGPASSTVFLDKGLQKAKEAHFKAVNLADEGLKSEYGPWVVAKAISPDSFEKRNAEKESHWKLLAYEK